MIVLYGVWMLALAAAYYTFPALHLVLWSSLALSSAGAIVAGVLIHRPSHPVPWWLLASAVTVFAAGDATYNVLTTLLGQENPFPSLADVFYLAMYPIAAAGLVILIRRRTGGRDRGSVLDALSVTTALALLTWIFLIDPHVRDGDPPGSDARRRSPTRSATSSSWRHWPACSSRPAAIVLRCLARCRHGQPPGLRRGLRPRTARRFVQIGTPTISAG